MSDICHTTYTNEILNVEITHSNVIFNDIFSVYVKISYFSMFYPYTEIDKMLKFFILFYHYYTYYQDNCDMLPYYYCDNHDTLHYEQNILYTDSNLIISNI